MAERRVQSKQTLGVFRRPENGPALRPADWIALALSAVWLVMCAVFFAFVPGTGPSGGGLAVTVLAVVMPVALIWVASFAARANEAMREESQRLQGAIDAMRQAYIATAQTQGSGPRTDVERKLDEMIRLQRRAEALLARLEDDAVRAPAPAAAPKRQGATTAAHDGSETEQPLLGLETPAEAVADPISTDDFIRALNFPEDEGDKEGFRALRLALRDRRSAGLVRSAQDVLTLLAEDGIYMDDLSPDRARPEIWRQFAGGARGRAIASLGGVRDRSSLALTAGRMRQDPVFRDVAHHFLRRFDQTFAEFEKTANDADIVAMSDTRTARAFMLLGRVSGTFD